jgi:hypothetical protein
MTVHFYHNEQFILKIYNYKMFFKQGERWNFILCCICKIRLIRISVTSFFTCLMFDFHDANDRQYFE